MAGLQTPEKPSFETTGSVGTVPPAQIVSEGPKLNVGVTFG